MSHYRNIYLRCKSAFDLAVTLTFDPENLLSNGHSYTITCAEFH